MPLITPKDAAMLRAMGADLAAALEEPVTYQRLRGMLPPGTASGMQELPDYEVTELTAQVEQISLDQVYKSAGAFSTGALEITIRQGVWPAVDAALEAARVSGGRDTLMIGGLTYRIKAITRFSLFAEVLQWELKVGRM